VARTKPPKSEPASRWIWPFELLERIGEGGMGVVYRARYVVNDREVAVKMLPDDVTSPTVLARFERELEVLKTLKHPHIVRSFGGACEDNKKFYAMELIAGGSLEDQLQERGQLPWETVVEYGKQMCAALEYLHENGVIHRDVKPANFLIGDQGQLKLSDFGLASVIAARKITSAGKTAGTLLYMAPEQIRGADIDARTDLYALGCVLFELLTGEPPFLGNTPAATMHMHCKSPIPHANEIALDCPVSLDRLITQCLAKDADDRPESAAAVARILSGVTATVTVVTRPRAIDRISAQSSTASAESLTTVEPEQTATTQGMSFWPFATALVVIAGMFAWNVSLMHSRHVAEQAEALWIQAARDNNPSVRARGIEALGRLGSASDEVIKSLETAAESENDEFRIIAVTSMGQLGAEGRSLTGVLHKIERADSNPEVRHQAGAALSQIEQADSSGAGGLLTTIAVCSGLIAIGAWFWRKYKKLLMPDAKTATASSV
jgi:serine/threonine-protein kinase